MKHPIFKNREFKSVKDFYHALKDNEQVILDLKKNQVYKSIEKGQGIINVTFEQKQTANKESYQSGFIYPVINSTMWLDNHDDVHITGCYKNTVQHQQGKVYYIDSHLKGMNNIIAKRNAIEMYVDQVEWKKLGKNIDGSTQCLMFKIAEENVKSEYLQLIKEDRDLQNSLAMRYVDIAMAVNTNDSAFKENKELYDELYNKIANKEKAEKNGLFFAVKELAIMGEGSLCPVIGGSNSATSVIIASDESEKETPQGTVKSFINPNLF